MKTNQVNKSLALLLKVGAALVVIEAVLIFILSLNKSTVKESETVFQETSIGVKDMNGAVYDLNTISEIEPMGSIPTITNETNGTGP